MLGNEHGGMNEVLANIYAATGEEKYLDHRRPLQSHGRDRSGIPARGQADRPACQHADSQIRRYGPAIRTDRRRWLKTASDFFWETVANERSYVIGGHSDGEMFSPKEKLSEALAPTRPRPAIRTTC